VHAAGRGSTPGSRTRLHLVEAAEWCPFSQKKKLSIYRRGVCISTFSFCIPSPNALCITCRQKQWIGSNSRQFIPLLLCYMACLQLCDSFMKSLVPQLKLLSDIFLTFSVDFQYPKGCQGQVFGTKIISKCKFCFTSSCCFEQPSCPKLSYLFPLRCPSCRNIHS
jgi:hypothetical protein